MDSGGQNGYSPVNNQSILSLIFGVIATMSFCTAMLPLPFTGLLCLPVSFLFGMLALVFGVISLNRIRRQNESGRPMAWMGIMIGGFIFLCMICMIVFLVSLFMLAPNTIHLPPYIPNPQL
jgi:hypothetical protein